MEEQTRSYLRGRFGDHYRREGVEPPPAADAREWGYIPWSRGGTRMIRHQSLLDLGEFGEDPDGVGDFLAHERPRHVYYSAAYYDEPGVDSMDAKRWQGADLVFDLDADHLPEVDPEAVSYREMLAACKDALVKLLDVLETDLGFREHEIVFSGGRGYHVHVRDQRVRELGRAARREIADYVLGAEIDFDAIVQTETVGGDIGRETPAQKRTLPTDGGWGARTHRRLLAFVDELLELDEDEALERLQSYEGIGEGRAQATLNATRNNYEGLASGNVDIHPAVVGLAKTFVEETVASQHAPIDEPVTTDINRLIRLPGSLHGGSGLRVVPLELDALDGFDPFVDAVPETFRGQQIAVDVKSPGETPFPAPSGGGTFTVEAGVQTVPEYVGVFLMARGRAEKGRETNA